jgi:hypothetical protein
MLVDSNSQRGSVVLRGVEMGLDTDIGQGFALDCARYCEGLITEDEIKSKYGLDDSKWARLADNEPLQRAVQREKQHRIANGAAARERAQLLFVQAPNVLGEILNDTSTSPRHRIEAARELRQVAEGGSGATSGSSERFIIRIDLTAGGGEVIEFNKPGTIEPGHNEEPGKSEEHEPI